ncbi:MAG: ester cyclase [Gemmatimonadaceae bacterium]
MQRVWNQGDGSVADQYVAPTYTIHSDPGDPWEGQTLTIETFRQRLSISRGAFPDLRFEIDECLAVGDRVLVTWTMHGTNTGALGERAPTHRRIAVRGMTLYDLAAGRLTGHRQVVDRLAVAQQLGILG